MVDPGVGFMAETTRTTCFVFGETLFLFQVFIAMTSARYHADRFYTDDFTDKVYTAEGMHWIENSSLKIVLLRNFPELEKTGLADTNAFFPWNEAGANLFV